MATYTYKFDGVEYDTPNRLSTAQLENLTTSYREAGITHPTAVEQQRLAREDLINNVAIKDSFNKFYLRRNGKMFEGTDEELVDEYMEQMRYFDTNIGSIARLAGELQGDYYTEEERQALGVMWNTWDSVIPFTQQDNGKWDAIWDYGEAAATDLSNYLGIFTGGAATLGSLAAKQAAKAGVRSMLKQGLISGTVNGAAQGAIWSAAQSVGTQSAKGAVGIGDGIDFKETAIDASIGAAVGGGIGAVLGTGAGAVKSIKGADTKEIVPDVTPNPTDTRATMDAAEAAEKFMEALADNQVQGEARDAARNAFIESMGKAVQRQGAGVKKTNDQLLQEGMELLQGIGVKNFEVDEVVTKLFIARNKKKLGMDEDQFGRLAVHLESVTWDQFRNEWKRGSKEAAGKLWDNFEKATTMAGSAGTISGRALQVQSLRGRVNPISFSEALEHVANKVDNVAEARLAMAKAVEKAPVWRNMGAGLNEFFINNILSSPVTLTVNTVSGYVHGWDRALTTMAAGVKNANGKLIRQGATQAVMQHYYIGQGLSYALRAFAKGEAQLDKGRNFVDDISQQIKIGDRNFDLSRPSTLLKQGDESIGMYMANILGNVNRFIGGRGMVATDELMKQMNFRAKLFQLELDDEIARGTSWNEAVKIARQRTAAKTNDYIDSVGMGIEVRDVNSSKALEEAREVTFQTDFKDDLFGQLGQGTQSLVNRFAPLRQIIPFVRTPMNILSYVGEKTPGLNLTSRKFREALRSPDPQIRQKAEMSMQLGTLLWASGIMAATSGQVNGPGPRDFGERRVLNMNSKYLPYSIMVDGKPVQINRYDPWAKFFLLMGGINDVFKYGSNEDQKSITARIMLATAESLFSMPALSGVNTIVKAMQGDPEQGLDKFLGNQAGAYVPFYRLVDDIMQSTGHDRVIYEQLGISAFAEDPIALFEQRWPYLAEEGTMDLRRDPIFGVAMEKNENLGVTISGLAYKEGVDNRVFDELLRLGVGKMPPSPTQEGVDMRKFPVEPDNLQSRRTVYDKYQEYVGRVEIGGVDLYQALENQMKSDVYLQVLTDSSALVGRSDAQGSREKLLSGIISQYRSYAHYKLVEELGQDHPYVQLSKREKLRKELNQTQQTQAQSQEIMDSILGPLGNNQ